MDLDRIATLRSGLNLLLRIPRFVAAPLSPAAARDIVQQRLACRAESFLLMLREGVYAPGAGPTHRLLEHAGIGYRDVESMVHADGVDATLGRLLRAGVYFSVAEYKGRTPIRRGSLTFSTSHLEFRNPLARLHVRGRSGGSRGSGTPILIDLEFIRGCGASQSVSLATRGGSDWVKFVWEVPGAGARFRLLKQASFGQPPVAWFSQLDIVDPVLHPIFSWGERALRTAARAGGVSLPQPVYSAVEHPVEVARFMREQLDRGRVPHTLCYSSSGVRLSEAALSEGIDLSGAQLTLGGEPITSTRLARVRESGLTAWPRYGTTETGPIGYPCLQPTAADEVHLLTDMHALIQPEAAIPDQPDDSFFLSSLHPRSPFAFINVSMGDRGRIERRSCGCAMEAEGFDTHVSDVSSFEKLTAAGMTFLDADMVRILEQVLPENFGGGPTDYQLEETLDEATGASALKLRAHPRIGPIDASALRRRVLEELAAGSIVDAAMSEVWNRLSLLSVERAAPAATHSAKILHLRSRGSSSS